MGTSSSKVNDKKRYSASNARNSTNDVINLQEKFQMECDIPLEVQVAHFTPSVFPLMPRISHKINQLCVSSWQKIISSDEKDVYGTTTSGITIFYNEFYERLDLLDNSGKFEAVLSRHASGVNKIAAKGAILVRIIKYVLAIEEDNDDVQRMLYMLGKSHSQKQIRPWQYGTFVQTLLLTIASRLKSEATNDVMESWVNLFAFVMRSMLPPAIRGQVVESELAINTNSEFQSGKIAHEILEVEEMRDMKKRTNAPTDTSSSAANLYSDKQ